MSNHFNHERLLKRATYESSSEKMTTAKLAINCQREASLQSPANESYHNDLIIGAPQFPGTACMDAIIIPLPAVR